MAMDNESRDRLANRVKLLRGNRSQALFAKELGVSQPTVTGWEKSANLPNLDNLERLAELANQLPEQLLAEIYGRRIVTETAPPVAFAITTMGNREISDVLILIANKIAGGG
jgi:transcriptional regulator with XRE-family HTH domain